MRMARRIFNYWNRFRKNIDEGAEERATAFGYWRYAFEYVQAAKTIDDNDPNPYVASSVTYQCVCQGIELAFKAYLRAKGYDLHSLRKLGHSLVRCRKAAKKKGLPALPSDDVNAIGLIDRYYKAHELRYIKTGLKDYPGIGELMRIGAELLDAIAGDVADATGKPELVRRMKLDISACFGFTKPPHANEEVAQQE